MILQTTVQVHASNASAKINDFLTAHPGWWVESITELQIHKIGGFETQVIVVFETHGTE
jgi:hypothetical protein